MMARVFGAVLLAAAAVGCLGLRPDAEGGAPVLSATAGHQQAREDSSASVPEEEVLLQLFDNGPLWWTLPTFLLGCMSCFCCCWRRADDVEDSVTSLPDITYGGFKFRCCGGCLGAVVIYMLLFVVSFMFTPTKDFMLGETSIPQAAVIMSKAIAELESRNVDGTVSLVAADGDRVARAKTVGAWNFGYTLGYYKFNFLRANSWDTEMVCPTEGWLCAPGSLMASPFTHRLSRRGAVLLRDSGHLVGVLAVTSAGAEVERDVAAAAAQAAGFSPFGDKPSVFNVGDQEAAATELDGASRNPVQTLMVTLTIFAVLSAACFGCAWNTSDNFEQAWEAIPDITYRGFCVRICGGCVGTLAVFLALLVLPALLLPTEDLMMAAPAIPKASEVMSAAFQHMEDFNLSGTISLLDPVGETLARRKTGGARHLGFAFDLYKFNYLKAHDWDTEMVCPSDGWLCATESLLTSAFTHRLSRQGAVLLRKEGALVGVLAATGGGAKAEHETVAAAARAAGYSPASGKPSDFNFGG